MENQKSYYAIIPAIIRYDIELSANAKLLYGEITALCNEKGYCWATNEYFAKLYNVSERTVTEWVKILQNKGYIHTHIETKRYEDGTVKKIRYIHIEFLCQNHIEEKPQNHIEEKPQNHIEENFAYNNTYINNTKENKLYKYNLKESKNFTPPTLDEIKEYCKQRNNNIDPQYFYDFFSVSNWIDSNGKQVKNWKQKIITWERNNQQRNDNSKKGQEIEYELLN